MHNPAIFEKKGNIYVHVRSLKRKAKDIAFAVTFM